MKLDPLNSLISATEQAAAAWREFGFRFGDSSTLTSRTIMLDELTILLRTCPPEATRADYVAALVDDNVLGKHTLATRKLSLQRLSEFYALDPAVPLFRLLRHYWYTGDNAGGQLAMLAALARDPLLRVTWAAVLATPIGHEVARQRFTDAVTDATEGRLNDATLDKVVRNAASSWTQSGHFDGRSRKKRTAVAPSPVSVSFALLLGYSLGLRGRGLFDSLFTRMLDRNEDELMFLAMDAKRLGWLDIKSGGGMLVVSFDSILTDQEKRLINGAY